METDSLARIIEINQTVDAKGIRDKDVMEDEHVIVAVR